MDVGFVVCAKGDEITRLVISWQRDALFRSKIQNREVSSSDAFAGISRKASCWYCAWGKNNMVVVEKKGARAINCKSEQTCSALCFFFLYFICPISSCDRKTKQSKTNLTVKYKSSSYISALIWRDVMNCSASQCCLEKHCRFLGNLLQSRALVASKPHKIFPLFSVYMSVSFGIWRC